RSSYDITELEDFIQGQIIELLPGALKFVKNIESLSTSQEKVSKELELVLEEKLKIFGLKLLELQVLSISPGQEILKAMEAKAAIKTIGDPKAFLLYQAAQSLSQGVSGDQQFGDRGNDPMQMMLGLMLGKNIMTESNKEEVTQERVSIKKSFCKNCNSEIVLKQKFCGECGGKL
ncbi:MAG: hypothetical protein M9962_15520, partial [Oligoflexia bacterium]|nr:hypothetical protein [Oligoflexia bacterium]